MELYSENDKARVLTIPVRPGSGEYRTEFRRDYARLIHSPCFRRLQGKTQLFPGIESDFFRNRLTHSLEVAQIAKTIAMKLNVETPQLKHAEPSQRIDYDLVELAGLAHDLGHPPFGHNGERALNDCAREHGGFESNAQTLRILAKLEKRQEENETLQPVDDAGNDQRRGLNLTFRSLASILKYANPIVPGKMVDDRVQKGFYLSELDIVTKIRDNVAPNFSARNMANDSFKTVECWIMDIADDIAYSTYDLEDAIKGGFVSPLRLLTIISENSSLRKRITAKVNSALTGVEIDEVGVVSTARTVFLRAFGGTPRGDEKEDAAILRAYASSDRLGKDGYFRSNFTAELVNEFVQSVQMEFNDQRPALSRVYLENDTRTKVDVLKHLSFEIIIMSPRLQIVEHRGYEVVKTIFDTLNSNKGHLLLPEDYRALYENFHSADNKVRLLCDFVAGMTDRYALEFYARIRGSGESIFKPF